MKLSALAILIGTLLLAIASSGNAQTLYVGANYHPHDDKRRDKIRSDIQLMKDAGFTIVRMGHLAWDSYEPADGQFDFEWFDFVMNEMAKAEIKVILDIPIRPAPIWLHHKHPSISLVDQNGNTKYPNHRYMEDAGDPAFQKYALRFTDALTKRYGVHPALLAFGIDNESGDGPISYSEGVRQRFIAWTKNKYPDLDALNEAWATQRWSQRINDYQAIGLPVEVQPNDVPEKMLDFRRFISDEINQLLIDVMDIAHANAPQALATTNAWYYSPLKYIDYSEIAYSGKMTRHGNGFYAGNSLIQNGGILHAAFGIARIQFESTNPFWCVEFTTHSAVPNAIRKSAYTSLMLGNQMVCGWTWQSLWGGREQYLEGMLDWDGVPNRKYYEYKQIAAEFKKIEKYLPYQPKAEIGLAFSFPSQIASAHYSERHDGQLYACFETLFKRNIDSRVLDINKSQLDYKLLMVPGVAVMDEATASKIRDYVQAGGTVVMTSDSAFVNEHGQVFATTRPGMLSDVFGIRIGNHEETELLNEISPENKSGKQIELRYKNAAFNANTPRFDVIDLRGAKVLASITSLHHDYPIITSHSYGKGRAIYVGTAANGALLEPLLDDLISELGIKRGPKVPEGVLARRVDEQHTLYLNISNEAKKIQTGAKAKSLLFDKTYTSSFTLEPNEPEFIETY
ncbi:beta-galactosidase [Pelagicoccus sp. SDUM812003]|uniref:beta-galactosidase n=1 Tax=Pelagicoccus sp. SDUM812003 TaxID=3041267 RepID=UPI00280D46E8|nr:beta-galactosidase [Pelagicoccus sp. SDUM812003]MDQ8202154.1 beta-galactosidase [Pelagicoccus sp. SDUM812003]